MAVIQGSKVVLQALIGDEYLTVMCAKSITFRTEADVVETTTKGDGRFKDFDYDQLSAQITLDAAHFIPNEFREPPVLFDLADMQHQFEEINFRLIYTDSADDSKVYVIRGQGIVKTTNTNASAGLVVDGTADILVKGAWVKELALPEYVDFNMVCFGNDEAAAQVRVQLVDVESGDIIFDTQVIDEAVGGWLENPFDITKKVLVGTYYMILEVRAETENNTYLIPPPPIGLTGEFDNGIAVINTKESGQSDIPFDVNRQLIITLGNTVQPPVCVPPDFSGSTTLPDGEVGQPYAALIPITGSPTFTLSDITKPSWMIIQIVETSPGAYGVQFSGTPDIDGTGINVTFTVNNVCGSNNIAQTIDIAAAPVTQSTVNWSFLENGVGAQGVLRIYVNSIQVVFRDSNGSGSFNVNFGDTIDVQVSCAPGQSCGLAIEDETAEDVIYFNPAPNPGTFKQFNWVAENGHVYEVVGDTFN